MPGAGWKGDSRVLQEEDGHSSGVHAPLTPRRGEDSGLGASLTHVAVDEGRDGGSRRAAPQGVWRGGGWSGGTQVQAAAAGADAVPCLHDGPAQSWDSALAPPGGVPAPFGAGSGEEQGERGSGVAGSPGCVVLGQRRGSLVAQ